MDARRCISYLTIELRGSIPEEFREAVGRNVYGCDICQDVCPHNRKAPLTEVSEFEPRGWADGESLLEPRLEWLAGMTVEEFREKFRGSAMKRTKWRGLVTKCLHRTGKCRSWKKDRRSRNGLWDCYKNLWPLRKRRSRNLPDGHFRASHDWLEVVRRAPEIERLREDSGGVIIRAQAPAPTRAEKLQELRKASDAGWQLSVLADSGGVALFPFSSRLKSGQFRIHISI